MQTQTQTPYDEIVDFLLSRPTPEQVIALHPSEAAQERLRTLLEKNRDNWLTEVERAELTEYLQLEHFVRRMKVRAREMLQNK